jgi:hypothetical protein
MRTTAILVTLAAVAFAFVAQETNAQACGGCFVPTENPTVVTDHRMILSISKTQSTLYDQIKYTGAPASFAWVLPISGVVTVGLSADIVFRALDSTTRTQLNPPPLRCPGPPDNCRAAFGASESSGSSGNFDAGVNVIKREVVGPYETVQLQATDPDALRNWLQTNGFTVPADVAPVVDTYVGEHFNFLALKLIPGKDVQDMRPVRVTTQGANVALPLRMVAAGTGANVGISLWVVGEGRYEPQNFGSFFIPTEEIAWDWAQSKSNYIDLRGQKTAAGNGRVWEIESSIALNRSNIDAVIRQGTYTGIGPYPQTDEARAAQDYLPVDDDQNPKTAAAVRDEDMNTLFAGIVTSDARVTRMRADLAHAALDQDLVMRASGDQTVLSNIRQLTKEIGQPQCPVFSGCEQVGTAPRDDFNYNTGSIGGGGDGTCATGTHGNSSWMGVGLGFAALAVAQRLRRRSR